MELLAKEGMPLRYDEEGLREDLKVARRLTGKRV